MIVSMLGVSESNRRDMMFFRTLTLLVQVAAVTASLEPRGIAVPQRTRRGPRLTAMLAQEPTPSMHRAGEQEERVEPSEHDRAGCVG